MSRRVYPESVEGFTLSDPELAGGESKGLVMLFWRRIKAMPEKAWEDMTVYERWIASSKGFLGC